MRVERLSTVLIRWTAVAVTVAFGLLVCGAQADSLGDLQGQKQGLESDLESLKDAKRAAEEQERKAREAKEAKEKKAERTREEQKTVKDKIRVIEEKLKAWDKYKKWDKAVEVVETEGGVLTTEEDSDERKVNYRNTQTGTEETLTQEKVEELRDQLGKLRQQEIKLKYDLKEQERQVGRADDKLAGPRDKVEELDEKIKETEEKLEEVEQEIKEEEERRKKEQEDRERKAGEKKKEIEEREKALESRRAEIVRKRVLLALAAAILKQLYKQFDLDADKLAQALDELGDAIGDAPMSGSDLAGLGVTAGGALLTGIIKIIAHTTQIVLAGDASDLQKWINGSEEIREWLKKHGLDPPIDLDTARELKHLIDRLLRGADPTKIAEAWAKELREATDELEKKRRELKGLQQPQQQIPGASQRQSMAPGTKRLLAGVVSGSAGATGIGIDHATGPPVAAIEAMSARLESKHMALHGQEGPSAADIQSSPRIETNPAWSICHQPLPVPPQNRPQPPPGGPPQNWNQPPPGAPPQNP